MSELTDAELTQHSRYVSGRLLTGLAIAEAAQVRRMLDHSVCARLGTVALPGRDELNLDVPMTSLEAREDRQNVQEMFNLLRVHPMSIHAEAAPPDITLSADAQRAVFAGAINLPLLSVEAKPEDETPPKRFQTTNFIGSTAYNPQHYDQLFPSEFRAARKIAEFVGEHDGMQVTSTLFDFRTPDRGFSLNGAFPNEDDAARFESSLNHYGSGLQFSTHEIADGHTATTYRGRFAPFNLTLEFVVGPSELPSPNAS